MSLCTLCCKAVHSPSERPHRRAVTLSESVIFFTSSAEKL